MLVAALRMMGYNAYAMRFGYMSWSPAPPTGITLDPSNPAHLWIVDNGTDRVYQYDNAVGKTSGSQAASISFALAAGNGRLYAGTSGGVTFTQWPPPSAVRRR